MIANNLKIIRINDSGYPQQLREIYDPPKILYYQGIWPKKDLFYLAVVGSRKADAYGLAAVRHLLSEKIREQTVIISGLAHGIDTAAHLAARQTIAVIGTGLEQKNFYPRENWLLARKVVARGGLIVSEFPLGTPIRPRNFPRRNRIIAGLSQAILVVEAQKRSGALITARLGLENGREVLSVPGSIFNNLSEGTNQLLAQGATLISSAEDLESALGII